jgi:hypothetical protein
MKMGENENEDPQPAGFGMPALYANRFSIRIDGEIVRIVFGDAIIGKHAKMHTHIVLKTADLEQLGTSLVELAKKAKAAGSA